MRARSTVPAAALRCARAGVATVVAAVIMLVIPGCAGTGSSSPSTGRTVTSTVQGTRPADTSSPVPIGTGPVTAAAGTCPLASSDQVADAVGMRLARQTVLSVRGQVAGCRFYALQDSPLARSENLPGPNQPAVEITTQRYRSSTDAHNAMVLRAGPDGQPEQIASGLVGVCFQTDFNPPDHGTDWACAFHRGSLLVLIRTVVTSPALSAVSVATEVARTV